MHLLQSSMKDMKYLTPCIPVVRHSQRSVCVKSPSCSALLSLWHGNGAHVCLAWVHTSQLNFSGLFSFTIIPVTKRLLSVRCSPLTPMCPNQWCQSSHVFVVSVERAVYAVTSSKYILSTFRPTAIKVSFLSYRWMCPSPMIACLLLSSSREMENRLFGACDTYSTSRSTITKFCPVRLFNLIVPLPLTGTFVFPTPLIVLLSGVNSVNASRWFDKCKDAAESANQELTSISAQSDEIGRAHV